MRLTINHILPDELAKATDEDLLWLHGKLHKAANLDRDHLLESHLLVVQEIARRDLPHAMEDGFDDETASFAVERLELGGGELGRLRLQKQTTTLQSLILSKDKFKTLAAAKKWIKDHDFKVNHKGKGPDETSTSFRFRQRDPGEFKEGSFRTIDFEGADGVKAVIGVLKKSKSTHKLCDPQCSKCGVCSCMPKADDGAEVERTVKFLPIEKADEEEQIVFGIALEPGEVDSQKDTIKPPVIKAAAHKWLAQWQDRGIQHKQIANSKIEIYESYVAPTNLTINGQKVKKGSWLLMYHILDDQLWKDIKSGKFTGFSIGGFARRTKV